MSVHLTLLAYHATIGPAPPTATRPKRIEAKHRKAVLVRTAFAARDDGSQITIGAKAIARETEMSEREVRYVLESLVHDGVLRCVCRGGGRRNTTEYSLDVTRLAQLAGEPGNGAPIRSTAKGAPGAPLQSRNSALSARNCAPSAQKSAPGAPDRHDRHIDTAPRRACALDARAPGASGPVPIGDIPNPGLRAAFERLQIERARRSAPVGSDDGET
jgi:hypothetical protein